MPSTRFAPGTWKLDDSLPAGRAARLDSFLNAVERKTAAFEEVRGRLATFTRQDVSAALSLYEDVAEDVSRISSYSYMRYTADTDDQRAKSMLDIAEELEADVRSRTLFFRLWWTGLPDGRARTLSPPDKDSKYVLSTWRKLRPFTLDENVERAVNLKNTTGFLGWAHHYDRLTSRFIFTLKVRGRTLKDEQGRPKKMVVEEVARLTASPDPETREAAYGAILAKYREEGGVLGEVYRTIVRDWRNENIRLRGYASPISPRNLENDVPDEAVSTLLRACAAGAGVFQDFFRLKAKMLGTKKMDRRHIYAPLRRTERKVAYGEAVKTVAEAYKAFDPRFQGLMLKVFDGRHVDSSPRRGKRSGAYCMSVVPSVVPYLFLNFAGTDRDVYTIAHESGHAIHSQLASAHSVLTFQPPLVLAETASVFGEMILFDMFMAEEKDAEARRSVLLDRISSMYATIGRQAHFVMFETAAHEAVDAGATVEELCGKYQANLEKQFGSAVEVPKAFEWEWTTIPHIYHTPFYCYAYAFGNLLSLALYERYTKEGRAFVPDYARILSYGGSAAPAEILEEAGFDIHSEKFWKSGFDVIGRMVGLLKNL